MIGLPLEYSSLFTVATTNVEMLLLRKIGFQSTCRQEDDSSKSIRVKSKGINKNVI